MTGQSPRSSALALLHRYLGLAALPFIVLSVLIALALTHTTLLHTFSARFFASAPIPPVALYEPVREGSLEQVAALATLAHGSAPHVITVGADGVARVGGFGSAHDHHAHGGDGPSPNTTYLIDTRYMAITRVEDETNSLFILGHALHAYDFFGIPLFNLGTITALAMLVLVVTGWMKSGAREGRPRLARWHAFTGKVSGVLLLLIALTTLALEFSEYILPADAAPSHALPAVALDEPLRPHSIDQGMRLAERAAGSRPASLYLRDDGTMKFSDFAGDNLFTAIYLDGATLRIKRLEDARNNYVSMIFLLHDGRALGGMDRINIADLVAVALLFSGFSGVVMFLRRQIARRR